MDAPFYDASKEDASAFAWRVCRESWSNSRFVSVNSDTDHFRSKRRWVYKWLPLWLYPERVRDIISNHGWVYFSENWYSETCWPDGIGTAVEFANAIKEYRTMARNLIAMSADDVSAGGDLPLVYMNVIDYKRLKTPDEKLAYAKLFEWLAKVAKEQEFVILTGESAGLWHTVTSSNPNATFPFNWSWWMNGISHKELELKKDVRAGDYIIALEQDGFASNGITKVREAFARRYWPNWFQEAPREEIIQAMVPPTVYSRALNQINGWYTEGDRDVTMKSNDHLSWGSLRSKFLESTLAPLWLSAVLDSLYEIPEISWKAINWLSLPFNSIETANIYWKDNVAGTHMSLNELYTTWCCGQRMMITVHTQEEADKVIATMKGFNINAKIAGRVIETPKWQSPHLDITARFKDGSNEEQFILTA